MKDVKGSGRDSQCLSASCAWLFHFPERILTPLLRSWKYRTQTPAHGKVTWQWGPVGNLSTMYLSVWCCDDLGGSLTQCLELPQELQSPSPLQGEEGEKW